MKLKNRHLLFFIFLFSWHSILSQNINERLLIGSWNLYSRTYEGKEKLFDQDSIIISFSKDKSFTRSINGISRKGRWTWKFKADKTANYSSFYTVISNKKHRGLVFFDIVKITQDYLILSNKSGYQITYSKYYRYEN